ncbi:MAG: FeoB-associated Cys-rich membrane protein [Oscillospiraceae bacterium]
MPGILGNLIVIAVLLLVVALAIRSLWKSHKSGGGCSGDCSRCQGCHGGGCSK